MFPREGLDLLLLFMRKTFCCIFKACTGECMNLLCKYLNRRYLKTLLSSTTESCLTLSWSHYMSWRKEEKAPPLTVCQQSLLAQELLNVASQVRTQYATVRTSHSHFATMATAVMTVCSNTVGVLAKLALVECISVDSLLASLVQKHLLFPRKLCFVFPSTQVSRSAIQCVKS